MVFTQEILSYLHIADKTGAWGTLGTIKPNKSFDPEVDVEKLNKALQDKGNQTIIDIVTGINNDQRQEVVKLYKELFQQDLTENLKKNLSGNLEKVIVGLLKTPAAYDAHELKATMKGLGTDEATLTEILCTRTSQQLQEIQACYKKEFQKDLEKDITSDTNQPYRDLLLALTLGKREKDSGIIDYGLIYQDSKILSTLGPKNTPNIVQWITIFTERSSGHLRRVFGHYDNTNTVTVEESIRKNFKGDFQKAMLSLVSIMKNAPLYFAEKLHSAMKGLGTNEDTLTRILVSRSEIDLLSIRVEYRKKYGKSLYSSILSEVKGDYRTALLLLCRAEDV
ncbi:annexin A9 [Bombina bombina]|uniref:annexin A9 n=1 Tax=Bombina bombina TaxID=8345 RepID=UPI00235AB096|nr:annexin A9 [Bombina bombina]XP_053561463.1 annexin A9 [Bombina bombina]